MTSTTKITRSGQHAKSVWCGLVNTASEDPVGAAAVSVPVVGGSALPVVAPEVGIAPPLAILDVAAAVGTGVGLGMFEVLL